VLIFVAMGGDQIRAINRTVDGDFAFSAAANGADWFAHRGAEARWFSFSQIGQGHGKQNTPWSPKKQKGAGNCGRLPGRSKPYPTECALRAGGVYELAVWLTFRNGEEARIFTCSGRRPMPTRRLEICEARVVV